MWCLSAPLTGGRLKYVTLMGAMPTRRKKKERGVWGGTPPQLRDENINFTYILQKYQSYLQNYQLSIIYNRRTY